MKAITFSGDSEVMYRGDGFSGAVFNAAPETAIYRYLLWRCCGKAAGESRVLIIGVNPSTATHTATDPTLTRCVDFAQRWGFDWIILANLFAFRSTDPYALGRVEDPIGPETDRVLFQATQWAQVVVCAWGNHGGLYGRGETVRQALKARGAPLYHLGLTDKGHPRHPLYLSKRVLPIPW